MRRKLIQLIVLAVLATGAWLAREAGFIDQSAGTQTASSDGATLLADAYDQRLNDEWIDAVGRVTRLLGDDNEGSRHQRFVIETSKGQSLLVAHNIDLAPRVPVAMGDRVRFRGVYEWNERGGVIHWTHHDPQRRHDGGWIEHQGKRYE